MKIKVDAVTFIILFIIFVLLKFMGLITWSWFWVLSPIWIFFAICFLIIICLVVYTIIRLLIDLFKQIRFEKRMKNRISKFEEKKEKRGRE